MQQLCLSTTFSSKEFFILKNMIKSIILLALIYLLVGFRWFRVYNILFSASWFYRLLPIILLDSVYGCAHCLFVRVECNQTAALAEVLYVVIRARCTFIGGFQGLGVRRFIMASRAKLALSNCQQYWITLIALSMNTLSQVTTLLFNCLLYFPCQWYVLYKSFLLYHLGCCIIKLYQFAAGEIDGIWNCRFGPQFWNN